MTQQSVRRWARSFVLATAALLSLPGCGGDDGGSGGNTGGSGSNANDKYAADRQACVDRINGFRATLNLPALKRWTDEEACTDGQAKSDSETGQAHGAFGNCKE